MLLRTYINNVKFGTYSNDINGLPSCIWTGAIYLIESGTVVDQSEHWMCTDLGGIMIFQNPIRITIYRCLKCHQKL